MFCKCGWDKFHTVSVYRGKAFKNGRWIAANADTRLVVCRRCGRRYYTQTEFVSEIAYNEQTGKKIAVPFKKED